MNGKGDSPRNCFSEQFRNNYDLIDWKKPSEKNNDKNKSHEQNTVLPTTFTKTQPILYTNS